MNRGILGTYGNQYLNGTRWGHNGFIAHIDNPATRSKQASEADPYFPKNENIPTNIIRILI